jgi:hypothetical protein
MNRTMRSTVFLWGRRLGIPLVKAARNPVVRAGVSALRQVCRPHLPQDRCPPSQAKSLRDYLADCPSDRLPIPEALNPHHEAAARLGHVRVVGESGQICLPHCLLSDVSFEWFMEPRQISLLYRWALPPATHLAGLGTSIAVISGHCYYHWLFNSLPRLGILEAAGLRWQDLDFIIANPLRHPFQKESLNLLGVPLERIRETGPHLNYHAESLALTTIPGFINHFHHDFLKHRLAPPPDASPPNRRLYVARGGSRHRQVINESEVIAALAKEGFEECHPEELTLLEQIRLFQQARAVVAPHGAALTNLVFCPAGTRVAEIFSAHYFNDCYQTLAKETGLQHWSLTHQPGLPLVSDHRYVEEPMRIHLGHLMSQLKEFGIL